MSLASAIARAFILLENTLPLTMEEQMFIWPFSTVAEIYIIR